MQDRQEKVPDKQFPGGFALMKLKDGENASPIFLDKCISTADRKEVSWNLTLESHDKVMEWSLICIFLYFKILLYNLMHAAIVEAKYNTLFFFFSMNFFLLITVFLISHPVFPVSGYLISYLSAFTFYFNYSAANTTRWVTTSN